MGGRTDLVVTYLITVRLSLPVILVALTTVALVGSSLWMVILVLGLLKNPMIVSMVAGLVWALGSHADPGAYRRRPGPPTPAIKKN